jgi:hypothetical protein
MALSFSVTQGRNLGTVYDPSFLPESIKSTFVISPEFILSLPSCFCCFILVIDILLKLRSLLLGLAVFELLQKIPQMESSFPLSTLFVGIKETD